MIQDLPGQTEEHIIEDLIIIERFKPAQVTWYILRLRPEAAWFSRFSRSSLDLSNPIESLRKRLLIKEGMERIGYHSRPGGRFVREDKFRDQFKDTRASLEGTLLGCGVSAYSHGWGLFFRNTFSRGSTDGIQEYISRINQGEFPIETGYFIDELERLASLLVFGIRAGVSLPDTSADETVSYLGQAIALLKQLESAGLVEQNPPGHYCITKLGSLFEEEICSLFYSSSIKEKLKKSKLNLLHSGSDSIIDRRTAPD
jgi:coproporphyrinogen III oxidase-like Fe-S oxidoreductase